MKQKIAQSDKKDVANECEIKIKDRINSLLHVYHSVAIHYADLHDTPERMLEKECISEIVPWRESRNWFYWRLKRVLLEDQLVKEILSAQSNLKFEEANSMLNRWFLEEKGATEVINCFFLTKSFNNLIIFKYHRWRQNKEVVEWLETQKNSKSSTVALNLKAVKKDAIISQIDIALQSCPDASLDSVMKICESLTAANRAEVIRKLAELELVQNGGNAVG